MHGGWSTLTCRLAMLSWYSMEAMMLPSVRRSSCCLRTSSGVQPSFLIRFKATGQRALSWTTIALYTWPYWPSPNLLPTWRNRELKEEVKIITEWDRPASSSLFFRTFPAHFLRIFFRVVYHLNRVQIIKMVLDPLWDRGWQEHLFATLLVGGWLDVGVGAGGRGGEVREGGAQDGDQALTGGLRTHSARGGRRRFWRSDDSRTDLKKETKINFVTLNVRIRSVRNLDLLWWRSCCRYFRRKWNVTSFGCYCSSSASSCAWSHWFWVRSGRPRCKPPPWRSLHPRCSRRPQRWSSGWSRCSVPRPRLVRWWPLNAAGLLVIETNYKIGGWASH